jgi:hypothetical protein
MPIVAFAASQEHLSQSLDNAGCRTVIQVSQFAKDRIEIALAGSDRCSSPDHIKALGELMERREFDAELKLLIGAIERYGRAYVRFV